MESFKYLKYTSLSKIFLWDYYSLNAKSLINSNYPIVNLKEVLKQRKINFIIEDNVKYKRCRVQINAKGVVLRDNVFGKEIKTKRQQICKIDDFLVAEIDAKVGGYGIVPDYLENAIVSSHYFLFEIDKKKLNPNFLKLITKQYHFSKQIKSTGSTNYAAIRPYHVLEYQIPLPSLEEQSRLVEVYNTKLRMAKDQEEKVTSLTAGMEKYFFDMLGIVANKENEIQTKGLRIVNYSQVEKWGLDFIGVNLKNSLNFIEIKIKEICKISSGGTPSRSRKDFYLGGTIPWVKTGELNNDIIYDSEEKITYDALKNSSAKLYPKNSLIIAMYGATIGKTAKLGIESSTNQACAVLFDIDNSIIDTNYLWEYLQTQTDNLKKLSYGSAQPNLNIGIISNFMVPIPPLQKQKEIFTHINLIKAQIKELSYESVKNRQEAIEEFGKQVFKD